MKRYLYMDLFEINENDKVEEETGKPVKVETKTTKKVVPNVEIPAPKAEIAPEDDVLKEINKEAMMSMPRKVELATYIKEKGGVPKDVMAKVTTTLGLNTATLKESDYDSIKEEIDKELGGE